MYVRVELKAFDRSSRVSSRFVKLLQDVLQGRHADCLRHIAFQVNLLAQFPVGNQFGDAALQVVCHLFHYRIAFRMHGCVVQWIGGLWDAEETGTLLKSLGAHARHLQQFLSGSESPVFRAVVYDVLCQLRSHAGYIGQ